MIEDERREKEGGMTGLGGDPAREDPEVRREDQPVGKPAAVTIDSVAGPVNPAADSVDPAGGPVDPAGSGRQFPPGAPQDAGPGLLELVYGTLFEPVKTCRRVAESPPMGKVALLFTAAKLLSVLVILIGGLYSPGLFTGGFPGSPGHGLEGMIRAVAPAAVVLGLTFEYLKWFTHSGILFLLAGLFGGRGSAPGALTATGLASLPALAILPVQILAIILAGGRGVPAWAGVLFWLVTLVWGTVLVIIGLRETQQLSTGRAAAVVLVPAAVMVVLAILLLVFLIVLAVPLSLFLQRFDDISF